MSWNDPERDDQRKKKDPWGKNDEGPPDIDEAFRQFQNKLRRMFGGSEGGGSTYQPSRGKGKPSIIGIGLIAIILAAVYIVSGVYIVDPPEKAVVTRFGRYIETYGPGPHWIAPLIESRKIVNVEKIHTESFTAHMITKDKNIATAEIAIQYRVIDPQDFLFNLPDPTNTLTLAMRSALRSGVGKATLDEIMTEGRTEASLYIRDQIQAILDDYGTGIKVTRANLRRTTVPEGEVQEAYDDANAARQDQEKFVNEAMAEKIKQVNQAEGDAKAILNEAEAYKQSKILEATGYARRFLEVLPEYRAAPELTRDRLYIESMQEVYANSGKVLIDIDQGNNLVYIPLDKIAANRTKPEPEELTSYQKHVQQQSRSPYEQQSANTRSSARPSYSSTTRPTRGGA